MDNTARRVFSYRQVNLAPPENVFPLLCPVREKEWLDGWEYKMVFSKSGFAEQGCVFSTPFDEKTVTTWYITQYDPADYKIQFVRVTPSTEIVRIDISLEKNAENTSALIEYEYTALTESRLNWLLQEAAPAFTENMRFWEKAINHYLQTGEKLIR